MIAWRSRAVTVAVSERGRSISRSDRGEGELAVVGLLRSRGQSRGRVFRS